MILCDQREKVILCLTIQTKLKPNNYNYNSEF